MARLNLVVKTVGVAGSVGALVAMNLLSVPLRADPATVEASPKAPLVSATLALTSPAPAPAAPAPNTGKPPAATATPLPPVPPDSLDRYGKIWSPSNDVAHPLKLQLPFPNIGEIKIPSTDELNARDKLEELATLSDADIHAKLDEWPPYGKMSLRDQGAMLQRIQDFRDYRTKVAVEKQHQFGLLTLTPQQQAQFEKDYWDKRLQMDRDLTKQFAAVLKDREQKMGQELFREFSVSNASSPPSMVPPPTPAAPLPAGTPPVATH